MRVRNILTAVGAVTLVGCALSLQEQEEARCEGWPTEEFFAHATSATVAACLEGGADATARHGRWERTALHLAARASNEPGVITTLLEAGVDVNVRSEFGDTPLQDVLGDREQVKPAMVKALLEAGADPNVRDSGGFTPLHDAAYEAKDADVIEALLAAGADLEARTSLHWHYAGGETPLHIAVRTGAPPGAIADLKAY